VETLNIYFYTLLVQFYPRHLTQNFHSSHLSFCHWFCNYIFIFFHLVHILACRNSVYTVYLISNYRKSIRSCCTLANIFKTNSLCPLVKHLVKPWTPRRSGYHTNLLAAHNIGRLNGFNYSYITHKVTSSTITKLVNNKLLWRHTKLYFLIG